MTNEKSEKHVTRHRHRHHHLASNLIKEETSGLAKQSKMEMKKPWSDVERQEAI